MAQRQSTVDKLLRPRERVVPLALLWLVVLAAGLFGLSQLLSDGHKATGTSAYIPWGLWVALYIFFVETAAGMHLASTLGTVYNWRPFERILKLNIFLSLIFAGGGMTLIWLDMGRPERLWEFYVRPNFSSPMNVMAWIYLSFMLLQATQLAWEFWSDRQRARGRLATPADEERVLAVRRNLGYLGIPVAVGLSSGVGFLVGSPASQLFYQVGLYPLHFLATALASGAAVLAFVAAAFLARRDEEMRSVAVIAGRLALAGVAFEALFIFFDFFVSLYGGVPRLTEAVEAVITGPYSWSFWLLQIFIGMVIPFVVFLHPRLSDQPRWIGSASLMVIFGFVMVRINAVLPTFVAPQLEGLPEAFAESRLGLEYFPTATEWLVAILVSAVVVGVFYVGYRLLPLVSEPREVLS